MKGLIMISIMSLLNLIFSKYPATEVLVIGSSACGNCKYFYYKDVAYMLKKQNYRDVVNIKLLPAVHLIEKKVNGTYEYTHRFGEDLLRGAFAQFCANNLYSNDVALKWAASSAYSKKSLNETLFEVFPQDSGAKMIKCTFGKQAHEFARLAWIDYMKNGVGGMMPILIVNGRREAFTWDKNGFFIDSICKIRTDKAELEACAGVRKNELAAMFEKSYDNFDYAKANEDEIKEVKNEAFDYQKFWSTADEEDMPIVGFESRKNVKAEAKKEHLKFFDAADDDE